jgi:hypothetical protein
MLKDANRRCFDVVIDRFITEWVHGEDLHPDEAVRPAATAIPL